MFPEVVRAVSEMRPQAFVVENVRGLLFADSISYLKAIIALLRNPDRYVQDFDADIDRLAATEPNEDDEYRVEYRLLDAADFGLAQHRPRLFVVGLRNDGKRFVWPAGEHSRESLVEDLRDGAYFVDHPEVSKAGRTRARALLPTKRLEKRGRRWRTLRDVMEELGPPARSSESADDPWHVIVPGARLYGKHTGSRIDWVGKTVKAGVHGSPGGEHIVVQTPKRFRYLTVRECASLQGFPRTYQLPEKRTPAMRQLGNAVAVDVARAIAKQLALVLGD
jgi:DNA (cytosine-5)-methyltransferase 1